MAKRRTKQEIVIGKILSIIENHGTFSAADVNCGSPCIASIGKKILQLALVFSSNDVYAVTFKNGSAIDSDYISYEDIKLSVLEEILEIAEYYEVDCEKTLSRCRD